MREGWPCAWKAKRDLMQKNIKHHSVKRVGCQLDRRSFNYLILSLLIVTLFALLTGCGGGGGGGPVVNGKATSVTGILLRAEDNSPVVGATVTISGSSTTSAADGSFTLPSVPSNATSATITPKAPDLPRTLILALTPKVANNLGNIFTSKTGYTASAVGTVAAPINGAQQPVGNATVTIAGTQVKSGTDGSFRIDHLPVGLGADLNTAIGSITTPNFAVKQIFTQNLLVAGVNQLGIQLLGAPVGNIPPGVPYTIKGTVTVGGKPAPAGLNVSITASGGQPLGSTTTDASGNYSFWVVTGTYAVTVTSGANSKTVMVTLITLDAPITVPAIGL